MCVHTDDVCVCGCVCVSDSAVCTDRCVCVSDPVLRTDACMLILLCGRMGDSGKHRTLLGRTRIQH